MHYPENPPTGETPLLDTVAVPPPLVSRLRRWIFLALIGLYPIVIGLLAWGRTGSRGPALSHNAYGLLLVCALEIVIFGAVFGVAWLASRPSPDDLLLRWRGGIWTVPLGIAYSLAVRLAVALVAIVGAAFLFLSHLATPKTLESFISQNRPDVETLVDVNALRHNPLYYWLTLTIVSFVVAGLREELWRSAFLAGMRSLWPSAFGSRLGQFFAVAMAAVIFGLGHLSQGPLAVCLTGFLGFLLGLIMILHRSIWPAVIAHGAFDATSLALLPFAMDALQKLHPS